MSTSRSLQCVFAASRSSIPSRSISHFASSRRSFQSSTTRYADSKTGNSKDNGSKTLTNSKATSLDTTKASNKKQILNNLRGYTEKERAIFEAKYTPAQLAAIDAGEAAISKEDLVNQASIRQGPMTINYVDDFATIRPYIDKPIRAPEENYDPDLRFKEDEELVEDLAEFVKNLPEEPERLDWMKFANDTRVMVGKEEAELNPRSSLAPALPVMTDPYMRASAKAAADGTLDDNVFAAHLRRLAKKIGQPVASLKKLRVRVLVGRSVVNQTRMGKIRSQYYLTVAGNGNGLLGIGEGKAVEAEDADMQSRINAIRNMRPIQRYEDRTIYGDVKGKVGATELELMSRPPGFGIRCQDKIYEICKCAGISDLAARVTRARNPMNTVKATMQALLSQRMPEDIARGRGKKLVDVRKVYYGYGGGGGVEMYKSAYPSAR